MRPAKPKELPTPGIYGIVRVSLCSSILYFIVMKFSNTVIINVKIVLQGRLKSPCACFHFYMGRYLPLRTVLPYKKLGEGGGGNETAKI
jgi:hypothetical protein